ncbi:hypothetical protein EIP91_011287 [Steccherinum ochraceum]|uniref:Uncharacterized protein n=1 Tax=Steccherinum ochraceum TaxID=92696 RepID=A0A4R0R877_9APHY|nr:hypothetical protein EIP91_011287 [Steccherinum ochraceum]
MSVSGSDRMEIESLRDQLRRATQEIGVLRTEVHDLRRRLKDGPWHRLDPALLLMIFELAEPPAGFLDPSLARGPQSPWADALRTKKALTMVCKDWRGCALRNLYASVTLRRVGQAFALVWTLESSNDPIAPFIRSLRITFHVPGNLRVLVSKPVTQLFQRCVHATSLQLSPSFLGYYFDTPARELENDDEAFLSVLRDIAPNITVLKTDDSSVYLPHGRTPYPLRFFAPFTNVVSLSLPLFKDTRIPVYRDAPLSFIRLEQLTLNAVLPITCAAAEAIARWHLPIIKCFDLRLDFSFPCESQRSSLQDLYKIFEHHGTKIVELKLSEDNGYPTHDDQHTCLVCRDASNEDLQTIPDRLTKELCENVLPLCPYLKYAVLPFGITPKIYEELDSRPFPPLLDLLRRQMDVQHDTVNENIESRLYQWTSRPNVRTVSSSLSNAFPDPLPHLAFVPNDEELQDGSYIVHHVYGIPIVQTSWGLFCLGDIDWDEDLLAEALTNLGLPADAVRLSAYHTGLPGYDSRERLNYAWPAEEEETESESEDGSYMVDADASDTGSDESDDETLDSHASGEDENEDQEQLDEEDVLTMFFDDARRDIGCIVYA